MGFIKRSLIEKNRRRRGLLRVAAYFSVVTLVCGVVSVRHARAEYRDQTLVFGRQMLDLAKAANHDVTKIVFNGQPVHVGSSVTEDPPATVLRRYEDYCKENRGQTADNFTALEGSPAKANSAKPATNDAKTDGPAIAKAGFVRSEGDGDGAVVCFVRGPKTKPTTAEALEAVMATGELGALGELRYAYASKAPSGKTLVLTLWTDSTFNLGAMIGKDAGDCPGEDFPELPRVPNATRVVSAKAEGTPYGINVYKTKDAPKQTLNYFDREMKSAGWFTYDPEMTEEEHKGQGRAYMKDAVVVTLGTSVQPEGTFVAVGLAGVAADGSLGRR